MSTLSLVSNLWTSATMSSSDDFPRCIIEETASMACRAAWISAGLFTVKLPVASCSESLMKSIHVSRVLNFWNRRRFVDVIGNLDLVP